jgi:lactoylglutathione lyase
MDVPAKPNVTQTVPLLDVKDMPAALTFYVDGLGFKVKTQWTPDAPDRIRWCWLQLGTAALMVQATSADSLMTQAERGVGVRVCFMCTDALAIYREAVTRGLTPKHPFVGNGLWVVSFTDPDGYRIDFESPTDVPEDTEYAPTIHA